MTARHAARVLAPMSDADLSANPTSRRTLGRLELAATGADLVHKLGGRWEGDRGMCRCPLHADRTPSLSVRLGDTNLLFHCFAGCDTVLILRWINRSAPAGLRAAEFTPASAARGSEWMRARAQALWDGAIPVGDTPAQRYLRARAILSGSDSLRYHARTPLGRGRAAIYRPALLAKIEGCDGLLAVQRTFLDARLARRARDLGNPRRLLGRPGRGAVRLFPATEILGLAEGVETAMSAAALLRIPVWAVLGNERFPRVALPDSVKRLILLPDNDHAGRRAAAAAAISLALPGREIETLRAWHGLNDWNDALRHVASDRHDPVPDAEPHSSSEPSRRVLTSGGEEW